MSTEASPANAGQPERGQRDVEGAETLVVEPAPHDVAGDVGRHDRQEDRHLEQRPAAADEGGVEQQRVEERKRDRARDRQRGVDQRASQRGDEDRVGENGGVVGQADPLRRGLQRARRRRERNLDRQQDRPDAEHGGQRRERQHEQPEHADRRRLRRQEFAPVLVGERRVHWATVVPGTPVFALGTARRYLMPARRQWPRRRGASGRGSRAPRALRPETAETTPGSAR